MYLTRAEIWSYDAKHGRVMDWSDARGFWWSKWRFWDADVILVESTEGLVVV